MQKSTEEETQAVLDLIKQTRHKVETLIQAGKKVHFIWDFDGVLIDSRSDDVFTASGYNLKTYFEYEERLLFDSPDCGPWLLPIAHTCGTLHTSQDIVTARSSFLALRVHLFCLAWNMPVRWMLFLGHQPKTDSFRIILESFKKDSSWHIFFVDDNRKHVETFNVVSKELEMSERAHGIVSPIIREYTEEQLRAHLDHVLHAEDSPVRIRKPENDCDGFTVLPGGLPQFKKILYGVQELTISNASHEELRRAFRKVFGPEYTDEDLEKRMHEFIVGLHTP